MTVAGWIYLFGAIAILYFSIKPPMANWLASKATLGDSYEEIASEVAKQIVAMDEFETYTGQSKEYMNVLSKRLIELQSQLSLVHTNSKRKKMTVDDRIGKLREILNSLKEIKREQEGYSKKKQQVQKLLIELKTDVLETPDEGKQKWFDAITETAKTDALGALDMFEQMKKKEEKKERKAYA